MTAFGQYYEYDILPQSHVTPCGIPCGTPSRAHRLPAWHPFPPQASP